MKIARDMLSLAASAAFDLSALATEAEESMQSAPEVLQALGILADFDRRIADLQSYVTTARTVLMRERNRRINT